MSGFNGEGVASRPLSARALRTASCLVMLFVFLAMSMGSGGDWGDTAMNSTSLVQFDNEGSVAHTPGREHAKPHSPPLSPNLNAPLSICHATHHEVDQGVKLLDAPKGAAALGASAPVKHYLCVRGECQQEG